MSRPRRHVAGTEKVAILKRLIDKVPVSDLCDEHDLYPNQFYGWLKEFFKNGHAAFDTGRKSKAVEEAKDQKLEKLEAKLQRKDSVLAEFMEEHVLLKKELGRSKGPLGPARHARHRR
ncbi:MAG TPA: transposase [Gemmataceae bacterium]|jgi:transposase-like protein|nr:transposase [Gemmataceae bacterium]